MPGHAVRLRCQVIFRDVNLYNKMLLEQMHLKVDGLGMLVQARMLQDALRRTLGTDLTQPHRNNPFHHTGNAVPLDQGDAKTRRPWEFWRHVAEGRSAGVGRQTRERWDAYVSRYVSEHLFPY